MAYCDICDYPAPCGRDHYWEEKERAWEKALDELNDWVFCKGCGQFAQGEGPWCELYALEGVRCVFRDRRARAPTPT